MNKRFLLVAALCAAMNAASFAQTNLAEGKTASASSNIKDAGLMLDNNLGTRWAVDLADKQETGYWVSVDLGQTEKFNNLQLVWEGGYAKKIAVYTATKLGDDGQPQWSAEPVYTSDSKTMTSFPHTISYNVGEQEAQYVKIKSVELGFAPYFSIWEVRVFNLDDPNPVLTSFTTSTESVKVGQTFTISSFDQYEDAINADYEVTNAEKQPDGSYKALAEGEIKITAKVGEKTLEKTIKAFAPVINTLVVSPAFVMVGEKAQLTFTAKDQDGGDFALTDAEYSTDNGTITDGKLTVTKGGKTTITATVNGHEATAVVYALDASMAPNKPEVTADEAYGIYGQIANPENKTASWQSWGGADINMEEITLGDTKVKPIQGGNKFNVGLKENGGMWLDMNNTEYDRAVINVFPTADVKVEFMTEGTQNISTVVDLKAGQWQSIELKGISRENNNIKCINLATVAGAQFPSLLISDLYLIKATGSANLTIGSADAKGFIYVTGTITSNDLKTLEETDGTAFNLKDVKLGESVSTVKFKNPNAIIQVAGTVDGQNGVPTADWGDTKNVVVQRGDGYYFPTKQLEITDKNPVYTDYIISGQVGFKYTRQLAANTSNTVYLPSGASAAVPDGCKAYEMVQGDDANTIKLNEVNALAEKTPYIVYNGNTEEATLVAEQKAGDVNFQETNESSKTIGNLIANGTYQYFNGDGTQYGLQASTGNTLKLKKVGTDATICPFRVYFTVAQGADAKAISFDFGNTTGINDIQTVDAAKAANIYSIDGKLVKANATSTEDLAKGVYIINGKKYIVK